jgi:hypothetical protein
MKLSRSDALFLREGWKPKGRDPQSRVRDLKGLGSRQPGPRSRTRQTRQKGACKPPHHLDGKSHPVEHQCWEQGIWGWYLPQSSTCIEHRDNSMLVKVYRHGPSRQRLLKGYVVAAEKSGNLVQEICRGWPRDRSISLYWNAKQPGCIWLDTGAVWLHTVSARAKIFSELASAVSDLAARLKASQACLLPNAVRKDKAQEWRNYICGDEHFLETVDDVEREVCCNLIRSYSPALIALTGRSGVTERKIERIAACQLSNSGRHYTARYLASVSPMHLGRVAQELKREEGVSRIDLLDVTPEGQLPPSSPAVHVRCIDGQILLSTAKAHAILCEALLIKSRRMVRAGRRVGAVPQRLIEENRARAIADGLFARLACETAKRPSQRRRDSSDDEELSQSASDAVLEMLFDLQDEFQILEASYEEISPLVLGLSLRRMGHAGIRNENDLIRTLRSSSAKGGISLTKMLEALVRDQRGTDLNPITQLNERSFAGPVKKVNSWWELLLRSDPTRITRAGQNVKPDRQPRESRRDEKPSAQKSATTQTVIRAAERLFEQVQTLSETSSSQDRLNCLEEFRRNGGGVDIGKAFMSLGRDRARAAREKLRPPRDGQFRIRLEDAKWDSPSLQRALSHARDTGLAMISCEVEENNLSDAQRFISALYESCPDAMFLYQLQLARYAVGERNWGRIDSLLVRSEAKT